ncbi:alginate lyase family protein [Myceligenerans crystallogenes]|uniref:Alginate lyase family protein n=1 Tax=Myceligenerans crystallogenes TaxID=316335 RepID=A0ABP4ZQU8_9MICO
MTVLIVVSGCAPGAVQRASAEPRAASEPEQGLGLAGPGAPAESDATTSPGGLAPPPVVGVRPAPDEDGREGDDGRRGGGRDGDDGAGRDDGAPRPDAGAAPDGGFEHPGILLDQGKLDRMRSRVASGAEPWASEFDQLLGSRWGSLDVVPHPYGYVECGAHDNPDNGCREERFDAHAAYAHALAWYVTEDSRHAEKAIEIMDAWSATIKDHTNVNEHLQAGWAGAIWPRAAEIIRYTYDGWAAPDVERFEHMLRTAYLPDVSVRNYANGNWELAMTEAAIAIAVFTDDRPAYDRARAVFQDRAEAYVYLASDGAAPLEAAGSPYNTLLEIVAFWRDDDFGEGATQETCRDLNHAGLGLAGMSHNLATTAIQGDNLYGTAGRRLAEAFELHARIAVTGEVPSWLCDGSLSGELEYLPDSALTTLTGWYGCEMSWSRQHNAVTQLPYGSGELLTAWEPLTHGAATAPPAGAEASPTVCPT